MTQKSVPTSQ